MAESADRTMPDDWLSRLVEVNEGKAMSETNTTTMATAPARQGLSALGGGNISLSGQHPMSKQPTVADYIVGRLAREGITDCFGVAGDFAFKLCDAVARSEAVRWIGCSNELGAAYAADGYARVRGCSMLLTTYAVGELSRAERRDGRQGRAGRASSTSSACRRCVSSARRSTRPPHARRRGVPELREHPAAGGVRLGSDHPRQLRPPRWSG